MSKLFAVLVTISGLGVVGCGFSDEGEYGRSGGFGESGFAVQNAEGERDRLRTGTALNVAVGDDLALEPYGSYEVKVANINTGSQIASARLLADALGKLELTTVAHDLGEFDDTEDGHTLSISIEQDPMSRSDGQNVLIAQIELPVIPHRPDFTGHGFQVNEVQPPHVYSALGNGRPNNAYVVGAVPDPGEIAAPIYAGATGLPVGVTSVDVYLVKDRDRWQGETIPQRGDAAWIAGPVVGEVIDGRLKPTDIGWQPGRDDIGPYDIIVDVNRDGTFDYSLADKDGADGENKVGLTLQYGAAWGRARQSSQAAQLSAEAARAAQEAADAAATKVEALTSPDARAKAKASRVAANKAKTEWQRASSAATAAQAAFDRELADATVATARADEAAQAAQAAAELAQKAAIDATDAEQAQKAWREALAAKLTASHLVVNLAFGSKSRGDKWLNSYGRDKTVYSYINPPVQRGAKHAGGVKKVVVEHRSFAGYWNNPDVVELTGGGEMGRIPYTKLQVKVGGGTPQKGCTNSPPVALLYTGETDAGPQRYDVIFDYGDDGYYDVGVDWIDVVSHTTEGRVINASELTKLPDAQLYGFEVK